MRQMLIVHICSKNEWQRAQKLGLYRATGMEFDGFIHCSRPEQVLFVANQFYAGQEDLVLLWIDPHTLEPELRWEAKDGEIFPHIYGNLNLDAVIAVVDFCPDQAGVFRTVPPGSPEK